MAEPLRPLSRPYLSILTTLYEAGGHGTLDMHGRITVGPTRHILPGDTVAWLVLVSRGLVAGEDGRIILTEIGRAESEKVIAGRVREAV